MPDTLTTITKLIQSPPGQLAAGAILAGIVWKFFERVEAVLTDQTKLEIAVWLLGRKSFSPALYNWPETFGGVFDRVFGAKHISWLCFKRSLLFTYVITLLTTIGQFVRPSAWHEVTPLNLTEYGTGPLLAGLLFTMLWIPLFTGVVPDYASLLKSRYALKLAAKSTSMTGRIILCLGDTLASALFALVSLFLWTVLAWFFIRRATMSPAANITPAMAFIQRASLAQVLSYQAMAVVKGKVDYSLCITVMPPAFFTSIWLWLYAGSGFILKVARRFDIGFEWFNRKFDIEKKPLQSIGLVAGALVAMVYWVAVIVSRI